jgi:hypothetical protein
VVAAVDSAVKRGSGLVWRRSSTKLRSIKFVVKTLRPSEPAYVFPLKRSPLRIILLFPKCLVQLGYTAPMTASLAKPLHVCHCADSDMEAHLPALFWSIARSHGPQPPLMHFVCLGGDAAFPSRVRAEATRYGLPCETYLPTTGFTSRLNGLRTYEGGCRGNPGSFYGRWFLPELLPADLDRVVYLDADVLVQSNLRELLDLVPTGVAAAAVPDMPFDSCPDSVYRDYYLPHLKSLGICTRRGQMFNSGVLVVSLRHWRDQNVGDLLLETRDRLMAQGVSLRFQDQDVLNVALGRRIHALPADWNVTPLYLPRGFCRRRDLNHVNVLHFVTTPKPWQDNQWLRLPAQAVVAYVTARACSELNPEESRRWRTYLAWYEQLTTGFTTRLTPGRKLRLQALIESYHGGSTASDARASGKTASRT